MTQPPCTLLVRIIKPFPALPHYKRATTPQPPSPPFLPYCALSILLLSRAHVQAHVLGRVLLHKEHGLITADLDARGAGAE